MVLCADDFAISPGVSAGIIDLLARRRLSATSCMTTSRHWPSLAGALAPHRGSADIGLHLTLTDAPPLGEMPHLAPDGRLPPLGRLLAAALSRRLDRPEIAAEIAAEIRRQFDAFVSATGCMPDFVDGHQHVHLLPVIRGEVLALFAGPLAGPGPYLRVCWEPPGRILARRLAVVKAAVLAALSLPLRREARRRAIACNDSFRGVSDYAGAGTYLKEFPRFLRGPGDRPIIMSHPGFADAELAALDALTVEREREHAYFASDRFLEDLALADCRLARFAATGRTARSAQSRRENKNGARRCRPPR
ncbi:MAG: ChbG/HpnK family deacetylase [Rhodospirillales bacterium]|nr:ChbG/HpnK family deacetylase [Rhodospirillales bacterium]